MPTYEWRDLPKTRTRQAIEHRRDAVMLERQANDPDNSPENRAEASDYAATAGAEAIALLALESPLTIAVGEVVNPAPDCPKRQDIADTLANPTQVCVDASIARTDLLRHVRSDVLALGVDAAHSIKARNSLEKMLAHQLALLHSVSMRSMDQALTGKDAERVGMLNSCTRMMDTFQRGLLTIERLRSGGSQTVVVKHVTVESGGQALIGSVKTGVSRTKRAGQGGRRK